MNEEQVEARRKRVFDACVPILDAIRKRFFNEGMKMALIAVDPDDVTMLNVITEVDIEVLIKALQQSDLRKAEDDGTTDE